MIEIAPANDKAIVRQIIESDGRSSSSIIEKDHSPPPSLETLSISTTSSSNHTGENYNPEEDEDEFNDCSSSVSSQDSSNLGAGAAAAEPPTITATAAAPKRSMFSQYWKKTGQKPVSMRPERSLSSSSLPKNPCTLSSPPRRSSSSVTETPPSSHSIHFPLDRQLPKFLTNADLLEDDGIGSDYPQDPVDKALGIVGAGSRDEETALPAIAAVSSSPQRRRSILPPAPHLSHSALRSTVTHGTKSWRKSVSLSNVEGLHSISDHHHHLTHKTRSLPRMSSTSVLSMPRASCLRPYQKYSPNNKNKNGSSDTITAASNEDSSSVTSVCSQSTLSMQLSASSSSSPPRPGVLTRSDSSSTTASVASSVTFSDAVDVRHFETPRESYSLKGWSEYFK